ncbi:MAG: hypothetical protein ACT4QB_13535 [Gammaproteobacteria bacterium]
MARPERNPHGPGSEIDPLIRHRTPPETIPVEVLARSQRHYDALLNGLAAVVWEMDAETLRLTFTTRNIEAVFDITENSEPEEALKRRIATLETEVPPTTSIRRNLVTWLSSQSGMGVVGPEVQLRGQGAVIELAISAAR